MTSAPEFLLQYQQRVNMELDRIVPADDMPPVAVHRSMRYTLMAPSKRVRAALTILGANLCGRSDDAVVAAASVELVHAGSLILDDLPSMDNAPLRRGRPANHIECGEAIAVLAAFGLLNLAFGSLVRVYEPPLARALVALLADAVGSSGLIGGQADDLLAVPGPVTFDQLERIHRLKTGALFSAAATMGAMTAGADANQIAALSAYAKNLGLAFQIVDDLLDVEGDPAQTGKATRSDLKKTTFVSFSGVAGARQLARELCETANAALGPFGERAGPLRQLSAFVANRAM